MYSLRLFSFFLSSVIFLEIIHANELKAVGKVILSKGNVTVHRIGPDEVLYLMTGDIVYEKDLIRTSKKSIMKLKFQKNGNLMLGPNSEVRLERNQVHKPSLISLLKGQLRSQANKKADSDLSTREKFLIRTKKLRSWD